MNTNEDIIQSLRDEIIELQTKIQFQEDTIHQLDKVLADQNERLTLVTERLIAMEEKVKDVMQEQALAQAMRPEKPPHY